jgi:HPt (histidine-containing phosphotransfer) domain-containing protein
MDLHQIAGRLGLEERDVLDIAALFAEMVPGEIEKLLAAYQNGDAQGAANVAHSLKGSSASLGLDEVASLAQTVVKQGRENRLDDLAISIPELVKTLQRETVLIQKQVQSAQ